MHQTRKPDPYEHTYHRHIYPLLYNGYDYFDELLERIREIRGSEKLFDL